MKIKDIFKKKQKKVQKNKEVSEKNKKKKKHIPQKIKKIVFILSSIIIIIGISITSYILLKNYFINKKYKKYEEKMEAYGFSILYDNQKATSSEKVTKKEMVKVIMAAIYNISEVESLGFSNEEEYDGQNWVKTALAYEVIEKNSIGKKNYDEEATYKETIMAALNARKDKLELPISSTKEASFKNLNSYEESVRKYINDAVENGIIEDSDKAIKLNQKIYKGQLNQIVVNIVEKYNTIVPEGETIVTKEESLPSNYDIYPYTLYSVDKDVYEYDLIKDLEDDYKSPKETYKYRKDYYPQVTYRAEQYYNAILNVNYNNITVDKFKNEAGMFLRVAYDNEYYSKYVDYVKSNKIIIEGTAKVQMPVFYIDGINYRVRVKLTFKILNSTTDKNLIFGDLNRSQDVTYKSKEYTIYIDAPMGTTLLNKGLRLDDEAIIDMIVSDKEARKNNEF